MAHRPTKSYVIVTGASSAAGSAVSPGVKHLRLIATAACWVSITPGGTAASNTTSMYMTASTAGSEHYGCNPGDIVTVIQDSAAGKLSVTEMVPA
jgi:hypothetical protein